MAQTIETEQYKYGVVFVSKRLNVVPKTTVKYANKGLLPCIRDSAGRRQFKLSDVDRFNRDHPKHLCRSRRVTTTDQ
jgi:predicted site-specific integrase-resolvase